MALLVVIHEIIQSENGKFYRIGFKIREAREKLGLTQAQLAAKVGKKREFISKIENDGKNITLKTLFEVIKHGLGGKLGVRVELQLLISFCF